METDLSQKRLDAYKVADDATKALYGNLELGTALGKIIERLHLDDSLSRVLINVIGDAILGFFQKNEIGKELVSKVGVSQETAEAIVIELTRFIALIEGPNIPVAPKDIRERLDFRPPAVAGVDAPGSPKPLTREEVLRAIQPKRTMASDIESVKQKEDAPARGYEAYYQNAKKDAQ